MALPPELRSACKAEARGSFSATPNGYSCPSTFLWLGSDNGNAGIAVLALLNGDKSCAFQRLQAPIFGFARLTWNCSSKPLARMTVAFFRSPQRYQSTTPTWNAFPGKADAFIAQASGIGLIKLPTTRGFLAYQMH